MARTKISEFSPIPGNNTDIDNINIAEGCPPSSINNAIRELMAQLKDFQAGTAGDSFNGPIGTTTAAAGAFTTLSASGAFTYGGVTLSNAVTGTGNMVLSTSPTLVTPALGTPSSATLTNATGLPIATGVSGLGAGVATFLATPSSANLAAAVSDETGTGALVFANSPTLVTPALGTPSALVGTNITGTAAGLSIGGNAATATTATTATTSTNVSGGTASVTTLTTSGAVTHNAGTANGVAFLNSSKVLTTGSALTFNGTNLFSTGAITLDSNLGIFFSGLGATNAGVYGRDAGTTVAFNAGNAEQMRLTSTGLGIGTSSPGAKLHVAASGSQLRLGGTNTAFYWDISREGVVAGNLEFSNANGGALTTRMTLDSSGNVGIGTSSPGRKLNVAVAFGGVNTIVPAIKLATVGGYDGNAGTAIDFGQDQGTYPAWVTGRIASPRTADNWGGSLTFSTNDNSADAALVERARITSGGQLVLNSGAQGNQLQFWDTSATAERARMGINASNGLDFAVGSTTPRMTITSGGDLLVGLTSSAYNTERLTVFKSGNTEAAAIVNNAGANNYTLAVSNRGNTGDNKFVVFATESSDTTRGSITYNRTAGLTTYSTTSDYRAKDIIGPVTDSGALIDATPVYMGKMKGATQERPMFIAHEVPAYAHTGVKDAVDADGNPVYQQMDASALVPVMWAELQSLRARVAQLESN